jgi:hypothetical protein
MILRIQDRAGRGPWKPGFSSKWVDSFRTTQLPPIYDEAPCYMDIVAKARDAGKHVGCAVDGKEALLSWFTPMEIFRLYDLGHRIVDASECEILLRTPTQLIVGSDRPFKHLPPAVRW